MKPIAAVIGDPVAHSASPPLHNAAFAAAGIEGEFVRRHVTAEHLQTELQALVAAGLLGVSVTVPHKESVLGLCDERAPEVRAIGAANCLVFRDGRVVAHNTDAAGFIDGLAAASPAIALRGASVVVLGAGGAARAVCAGLTSAGARVTVVARRPVAVLWTTAEPWNSVALAYHLERAAGVVDCTSIDLSPSTEASAPAPVPLERLSSAAWVVSLIYHRRPPLLVRAQTLGLQTCDGSAMLVHQAARAFSLWTGRAAPIEAMWRGLEERAETAKAPTVR